MKKKILIISHNLRIGGVERSLIGLLNSIDYSRFEVDLFLFIHDGEFLNMIPDEVNLIPQNKVYASMLKPAIQNLKSGSFSTLWMKTRAKFKARLFMLKNKRKSVENLVYLNYMQREMLRILPPISNESYDLALSFLTPHYIVAHKVNALKTIAWIHTDYGHFDMDKSAELQMWNDCDYIASVSDDCTTGFLKQFPQLKSKIILLHNILDPQTVRKLAEEFVVQNEMPKSEGELILCSVGRFSYQKNFDNVPFIARKLQRKGAKFKWYIIGFGGEENLIRENVQRTGMQNTVIILGKKANPYPYMKACDIYVQPSRMEGRAVSVTEAQILSKPVVIADYPTAPTQFKNGFDGLIVPMDNQACANALFEFMNDKVKQKTLAENCSNSNYGNCSEIEILYGLMTDSDS